jgi:hypothetical protein
MTELVLVLRGICYSDSSMLRVPCLQCRNAIIGDE